MPQLNTAEQYIGKSETSPEETLGISPAAAAASMNFVFVPAVTDQRAMALNARPKTSPSSEVRRATFFRTEEWTGTSEPSHVHLTQMSTDNCRVPVYSPQDYCRKGPKAGLPTDYVERFPASCERKLECVTKVRRHGHGFLLSIQIGDQTIRPVAI